MVRLGFLPHAMVFRKLLLNTDPDLIKRKTVRTSTCTTCSACLSDRHNESLITVQESLAIESFREVSRRAMELEAHLSALFLFLPLIQHLASRKSCIMETAELSCWERFKRFRGNAVLILIVGFIAIFTDAFIYGSVIPYYPTYAAELNVTDEKLGLVMSSFALTFVPLTPIFGMSRIINYYLLMTMFRSYRGSNRFHCFAYCGRNC